MAQAERRGHRCAGARGGDMLSASECSGHLRCPGCCPWVLPAEVELAERLGERGRP